MPETRIVAVELGRVDIQLGDRVGAANHRAVSWTMDVLTPKPPR